MPHKRPRLSKQAAALLNDFQAKAVAYGEKRVFAEPEKAEMLKARYRLEAYLTRCGSAARKGVRSRRELETLTVQQRADTDEELFQETKAAYGEA